MTGSCSSSTRSRDSGRSSRLLSECGGCMSGRSAGGRGRRRSALVGLLACLLRPALLERLRPGERGYAVAVATNLRQARLVRAGGFVDRGAVAAARRDGRGGADDDEILFRNGTALAAFPCSARGGRGWPICSLLMDEAAHFICDSEGPPVAERVFEALVPSTAQFGDRARVIVASTPWGTAGFFAELFSRASTRASCRTRSRSTRRRRR